MRLPELKAMMRLGLVDETVSEFDAFLIWGRLKDDPVLWQMRVNIDTGNAVMPPLLPLLAKLTPAEVAALKQRLGAC
jgi:hypothetical protein